MNDLQLIRDLDDTPLPTLHELHAARDQLMAAIAAEQHPDPGRAVSWRMILPPTRRGWLIASSVAAVAVAVLITIVATLTGTGASRHPLAAPLPSATMQPRGTSPAIEPAAFLRQAATAAQAQPDVIPRPDQFYYLQADGYEGWFSMDGTHDGLSGGNPQPGCRNGVQLVAGNYPGLRPEPCTPDPAYLVDAPTTAPAMAAYVTTQAGGGTSNAVGKKLIDIASQHYLRPAARAALFNAVPLLPGLTLSASTVTNLGAPAEAISWNIGGGSTTLLFNPNTYAYLGCTTIAASGQQAGSYNIRQGIVDSVGQRP